MRRLTLLVLILAALYGGYWVFGARMVESRATAALDGLAAQGWTVDYSDLATRGFPSRFDTTLTDVRIAPPGLPGLTYAAPFLQALALSYRPNRLILVWPETQTLTLPQGSTITLTADRLRASTGVTLSTDPRLTASTLESGPATVAADALGEVVSLDRLLVAFRPAAAAPAEVDTYAEVIGLTSQDAYVRLLDPAGAYPAAVDRLMIDATVTFDKPLALQAAGAAPRITRIAIKDMVLLWGDMQMTTQGTLDVAEDGTLSGQLPLALRDWPAMLDVWANSGAIERGVADTYAKMIGGLSADGRNVDLPLIFGGGIMRLGIIPIGAAPRL